MTKNILLLSVITIIAIIAPGCKSTCPACKEAGLIHEHAHGTTPPDSRTITEYNTPDSVTVWITNSNGAMTPITLKKQGTTYIGPNKEQYPQMPTPKQLKKTYGF